MYQESVSIERDIANAITHGDRPKIDIFANRSLKLDIGLCAKQFTKEDFCQLKSRLAEEYDLLIRASAANNLNLITHRKNLLTIKADLKTLCPAP